MAMRMRGRAAANLKSGTAGLIAIGIAVSLVGTPAYAVSGKERLAGDLVLVTTQQVQAADVVPKADKKRTAKCLAQAIVADIPEEDAAKLADMFERRTPNDLKLQQKWFTISKKDAPKRNAQVIAAVDKLCPDIGPYAKQIL